jgi:hypothetical protein
MLFDLQGKRKRVVQVTYLGLAILMGAGLVLFGVGSGGGFGGLFDAITGNNSNGGGSSNSVISSRIQKDEKALTLNPQNKAALVDLIRSHYQLATDDQDANTGAFGTQGKADLRGASSAWQRYLKVANKPDDSLASLMLQAYGQGALDQPANAAAAAEIVAAARPSASTYLALATYAARAGDTRKAQLAGQKAVALAPKSERKIVQQQVNAAKVNGAFQSKGASTSTTTTGG